MPSAKRTTAGSNPTSYPKTAFGIYGFFNKKSGSKNPESLDAVGFAPTASKVLGCYVTSKQYRCCQFFACTRKQIEAQRSGFDLERRSKDIDQRRCRRSVIFLADLKICLGMLADRAELQGAGTDNDATARQADHAFQPQE